MALTSMDSYKPYKNIRLKKYDYYSGYFFVSNKTNHSDNLLVGKNLVLVRSILYQLVHKSDGVRVDYLMLMPNHIHIILIFDNASINLSEFWRRFKSLTTLSLKRSGVINESLWQRNYYEHVIRNEQALHRIRKYIEANPYKENLPLREVYDGIQKMNT